MIDIKKLNNDIDKEGSRCEWNHALTGWMDAMGKYNSQEYYDIYISPNSGTSLEKFRDSNTCWTCKIIFLIVLFEWQNRFSEKI